MLASISGFCGPVITKFKESVFKFEGAQETGERKKRDRKRNLPPTHPANLGVHNLHYI
jgi:hypothetical protein